MDAVRQQFAHAPAEAVAQAELVVTDAVAALAGISRMNVALFEALSPAERETTMAHPEYGFISVDWIIYTIAGHHIHHLEQLAVL